MPEPQEETIGTQLAKLDGKIDMLSVKLDAHRDLLMAKMEAGDRESGQAIALTNERVSTLAAKVGENSTRLSSLEGLVETDTNDRIKTLEDAVAPVPNLTKLVYGFVALCLIAIVTALLAIVVRGGT